MRPARTYPDQRDDVRLLVIDPAAPEGAGLRETRTPALPELLAPGDLLVVNDAATLPASLRGTDEAGRPVEARLLAARGGWPAEASSASPSGFSPMRVSHPGVSSLRVSPPRVSPPRVSPLRVSPLRFAAVLFGAGDWHTRTEDRPPPPELPDGARLRFGALRATVGRHATLSPRLVELRFESEGDALWAALYKEGRPVQYAHLAHDLPLWAVQTVYATRPWAFEMPSAGRPLSWEILLALRRRGVRWASLTHAAGLSATGDPAIDAALPLPEAFEIPAATARAIAETRARHGRVVAVGTTVVRALEGAAQQHGDRHDAIVRAGRGETDLRITPAFRPRVVDGILSGAHAAHESHFQLLAAFAGADLLAAAAVQAERAGFLTHELGDSMLVLPGALAMPRRKATLAP
jgi:S-adenosylmethionine:tRNA ribosyltransferase-isomerase